MPENTKKISPGASATRKTNETLLVDVEMMDVDGYGDVEEQFASCASLEEGVSGCKSIDTLFENTCQDKIQSPRSDMGEVEIDGRLPNHEGVNNPAPVCVNEHMYPHRRY